MFIDPWPAYLQNQTNQSFVGCPNLLGEFPERMPESRTSSGIRSGFRRPEKENTCGERVHDFQPVRKNTGNLDWFCCLVSDAKQVDRFSWLIRDTRSRVGES